jgi:UDP-N-acetylmuramoyl-L-alanyl-D-glutamate--2,6-diaminopimelate ligase
MLLKELLKEVKHELIKGSLEQEVNKITYDNRKAEEGDVFFCIKGFASDGHKFAKGAVENGAKVIICMDDIKLDEDVTIIKVEDTRKAMALVGANYYYNPTKKLKVIGITGTNGKTTSAFMMKKVLEASGYKVGLIGTIANYIGDRVIKTERTTPESLELQELFNEMVEEKVDYCVMEVSSHALELDRVYGVRFAGAIFSNLTRDHLDFHKTFENYYKAKFKLFERTDISVINIDDSYGKNIIKDLEDKNIDTKVYTYSINDSSYIKADNIINSSKGVHFDVSLEGTTYDIKLQMPGLYNVYNALSVLTLSKVLSLPIDAIMEGLNKAVVPGRCERTALEYNIPYEVIIDYAHTPDGLENILKTAREFTSNRLISVFGCGGDRDKVKRPMMGKIGVELSDIAIVTSDNPRTEEPMAIIKDIVENLEADRYKIVENRREAIKEALKLGKSGDVIVIAGKGHENYQILKDKTIHFDEREVVIEILEQLGVEKC